MPSAKSRPLPEALADLRRALDAYRPSRGKVRDLSFIALTKAFEIAVEYGWKQLKAAVEDAGLEAPSPKDAVRQAAPLRLLRDPELWIRAINARNLSVHDYFSLSEAEFVELIRDFFAEVSRLKGRG
jgi:nucleotidyltransferase substrate binding protein (TIGR01987 family)